MNKIRVMAIILFYSIHLTHCSKRHSTRTEQPLGHQSHLSCCVTSRWPSQRLPRRGNNPRLWSRPFANFRSDFQPSYIQAYPHSIWSDNWVATSEIIRYNSSKCGISWVPQASNMTDYPLVKQLPCANVVRIVGSENSLCPNAASSVCKGCFLVQVRTLSGLPFAWQPPSSLTSAFDAVL